MHQGCRRQELPVSRYLERSVTARWESGQPLLFLHATQEACGDDGILERNSLGKVLTISIQRCRMTKHEAYASLINVAAILARGDGFMSPYYDDHKWCVTTPKAERRRIIREAEKVDSLCKDLAMRIKYAADAIRTPAPQSNPHSEAK